MKKCDHAHKKRVLMFSPQRDQYFNHIECLICGHFILKWLPSVEKKA